MGESGMGESEWCERERVGRERVRGNWDKRVNEKER